MEQSESECDNKNLGSEEDFNLNCQPCYRDGDDVRAHGYCIECEEHLCVTCYKFHRRTVLTRDHSLLDNLSMPRKAVKTVKNPINSSGKTDACTVECSDHQNKYIEYYCPIHKYLGCSVCVTLNHKHCDSFRFIPDIVDKNEVYATFVQTIDSLSLEFKDIKNVSEKNASEAKTIHSKAKQDKDGFRKVINSKLDLLDGDIDNKMKSVLKEDTKAMDDIKEMSDKRIKQLESVLSDTDDKHKVGQACNAFIAIKRVEDDIVSFTDDLQSLQQRNTIRKYKFKPDDQLLELMSGHPIGILLQPSKCKQESAMGPTNTPANTSDAKYHAPKAAEPDRLKDGKPVVKSLKKKLLELRRLDANVGLAKTVIQEILKDPLPKDYQKSGTDQSMSVGIDSCVICLDKIIEPKQLSCGHVFCTECITAHFGYKKTCPTCGAVCGVITGDQPDGIMRVNHSKISCAGYDKYNSIEIEYSFPSGKQLIKHPNPGRWYQGITSKCYLPNNKEGMLICELLKLAFDRKLVFTIGTSRTTGQEGVITWNDIHHKTNIIPNEIFGYPDSTYFDRVKYELAIKGITEKDIAPDVYKRITRDYH